jgi:cyclophilin family peptidyl-prolyl cis-trans isomerase
MNLRNPSGGAAPVDSLEDGVADFFERIRKNPRPFITKVTVLGVLAAAVVIGFRVWRTSAEGKSTGIAQELQKASVALEPMERVAILSELRAKTEGAEIEALRLYKLAEAYREVAEKATTGPEKVDAWQKCVETLTALERFPSSVWMKMPVKPAAGDASAPTFALALKSTAEKQLAWLKANPYSASPEPDAGLSVVFELDNGGSFTVGKFFSSVAPHHVQNFVNLCRDGYFEGTSIGTLKKWFRKAAATMEQSVVGVEMGDAMTKVTPDDRTDDDADPPVTGKSDLSYTIPEESNSMAVKRGSLVPVVDPVAGGDSPTRVTIFTEDVMPPRGSPFAEVTDGLEKLEALTKAETESERTERLKTPVKIKKVTVTGSVAHPPANPLPKFAAESLPASRPDK